MQAAISMVKIGYHMAQKRSSRSDFAGIAQVHYPRQERTVVAHDQRLQNSYARGERRGAKG